MRCRAGTTAAIDAGWSASSIAVVAVALDGIRYQQRVHARRLALLGTRLSDEVAWNVLLDLAAAEAEGKLLSVTALAIGSRAPLTTTLRYVGLLSAAGHVVRGGDRSDGRRSVVRLTAAGRALIEEVFAS